MAGLSTERAPRFTDETATRAKSPIEAPLYAHGVPTLEDIEALRYVLGLGMVAGDWEIKRRLVERLSKSQDWEMEAYRNRASGLVKHFASMNAEDLGEKLVRHRKRILEALVTLDLLGLEARPAWKEDLLSVAAFDVIEDPEDDLMEAVGDGLAKAAATLGESGAHLDALSSGSEPDAREGAEGVELCAEA